VVSVRGIVHPRAPIEAERAPIEQHANGGVPVAGSGQKEVVTKHGTTPTVCAGTPSA